MAEYISSTQSQRDNAIIMYYVLHHELSRTSSGAIAKGLGKILDSGGIIEYFCHAIFLCLKLYNEQFLSD